MKTRFSASLLAAVPMPLVLIGKDERIHAMNPGGQELFGPNSIGGNYVTVLRQPGLLRCIEESLEQSCSSEARYVQKDISRETTFKARVAPVAGGGNQGVLVSFEDISDMEYAGQMRRDFVANVSHELKSPLTAVLGFIETLRGAAKDDPAARDRFLSIMQREAERMNRLVSDLLSLSRVESTERQRPTDPVSVDELIRSTLSALRALGESAGVDLDVVREGDEELVVPGDADQLQQVLVNLIENAIKYGGDGGRVLIHLKRIPHELAFRGPAVEIVVEDFGDGFDPIHIQRLTERFYRVDNHRSRAIGGTGLGLAIAKHIVSRHRGRFRIASEPGQGATFTILLPAYQ